MIATLVVWWSVGSMALCSVFDVFSYSQAHSHAQHGMMGGQQMMQHNEHHAVVSYPLMLMDNNAVSPDERLCCDELQQGSYTGKSSSVLFLAVFLAWTSSWYEPVITVYTATQQVESVVFSPPIFLLICSFLK